MATDEMAERRGLQDVGQKAMRLAAAVIMDRIKGLAPDDRKDLYELVKCLPGANDDELESTVAAMIEILEQAPSSIRGIDPPKDETIKPGLKKWIDFVSGKIRAFRKELGLTQNELAEKAGIPQSHLSRLEAGKHSPSRVTLEKIAKALGKELSELDPSA